MISLHPNNNAWAATADERYPEGCKIASPEMKLLRACFGGPLRSSGDAGQFLGSKDGSGNAVNYCFNAYVYVDMSRGGPSATIRVLKDNKDNELREHTYQMEKAPAAGDTKKVVFGGLQAKCFAYEAKFDECSKGFFGFGGTDRAMGAELSTVGGHVVASDFSMGKGTHLSPSSNQDVNAARAFAAQEARNKLLTFARKQSEAIKAGNVNAKERERQLSAYNACNDAYTAYLSGKPTQFTADDDKVVATYKALASGAKAAPGSTVPAARGNGKRE